MDLYSIFDREPRILVAEDDQLNRDLLVAYLRRAGCQVNSAPDGQQALELAREEIPDLAVIDIMMPRMDGLELCQQLKGDFATRSVPVVIVTALDSEEERLRAIAHGADDFITKPYYSAILLTRVRSLLRIKKLHDEIEARNRLLRQILDHRTANLEPDEIIEDPSRQIRLEGEKRNITVLLAELRGLEGFCEKHTAGTTVQMLNQVLPELGKIVYHHQGTFDKYLGQGLMAFYGAPVTRSDDAQRAVACALEMQRTFSAMRSQEKTGMAGLALGIGLHSAEAIVGSVGSEHQMNYTAVGEVMKEVARLQEMAGGGQILISAATYEQTENLKAKILSPFPQERPQLPFEVYRVAGGQG